MCKDRLMQLLVLIVLLVTPVVLHAQDDYKGCRDHQLLSRMEGFYISTCREVEHNTHNFYDANGKKYVIEGHQWRISYKLKKGLTPPGVLEIKKNYIDFIQKIGGTVLKEGWHSFMKFDQAGCETWIELNTATSTTGNSYSLIIVETDVMQKQVTDVQYDELETLLNAARLSYRKGNKVEAVQNLKMGILSIWDELPLTVKNIRLVTDTTNYASRKNNVFRKGEPIFITSQIFGHKFKKVGDCYRINITTDFLVLDDAGKVLGGQKDVMKFDNISPIPMTDFSLDLTYTLSGAPEGTYNFQTKVNDKNSGNSTEFITKIVIK